MSKERIILPAPHIVGAKSVAEALWLRKSERECSMRALSLQDLSNVLWAANGVNRPEEERRTAPSALNVQDVRVYVFLPEGVYLYEPVTHSLSLKVEEDHRKIIAGNPSPARSQEYAADFPVTLLMVSDMERFGMPIDENVRQMAAIDAGIVSENISLFCASIGLVTVPRVSMDKDAVIQLLKLRADTQIPIINNPIGYGK